MPNNVEDVRLSMDRVRLGGGLGSERWLIRSSGFSASLAGEGGKEESLEAGVISKVLRGIGRCISGISILPAGVSELNRARS